jgi:hypothetical protein
VIYEYSRGVSDVFRRHGTSVNVPGWLRSLELMRSVSAWAEDLARDLLEDTLPRRWAHVQGVAARARSLAPTFGAETELLEAAAWLHDIGYLPELASTGLHGLDGARYLRDVQHADPMLCRLVAHHSCAIIEAEERGLADVLRREFAVPPQPIADALTCCDMTTSPDGEHVNVDRRLAEIRHRYGSGHLVSRSIRRATPMILKAVQGIVSYQTQQDPASKSGTSATAGTANTMRTSVAAQPSATDIVNGDSGAPSIVDTQYSIFSLIAILYFAGLFIANLDKYAAGAVSADKAVWLPQIPSALLGLTSLAALTYVGNKAVQTQGVRVVSFSPNPAPPNSPVRATLVNLPANATQATTTVWLKDTAGNTQSMGVTAVDNTNNTVTFQSPVVLGTYSVTIAEPDGFTGPATLVVQ